MMQALLGKHDDDALVAFGAAGEKTARDLRIDAAKISRALPEPTPGSHVLLVFQEDRYAMAAALLGAWHRGHAVTLPPSTRRDAIIALRDRPDTAAVIQDLGAGIPFRAADLLAMEAGAPIDVSMPADLIATVYTSGTTSAMTAWKKSPRQLIGEASALGDVLGVDVGDRVVATISPGHIYGLLFSVLLPLARGAAFVRESPQHAESIATCVARYDARVLVTVPLHVRALVAADRGALGSLRTVVSSTAPLSADVADAFTQKHERAITEILGSSETGGIAWRTRSHDARYRPLPGVHVALDAEQRLVVDSPFCDDAQRPFTTADLARLHEDGTLTHLGRSDGVLKIGGRRVAIADVEACIREHATVSDVAVLAVPANEGREHQLLAAVAASDDQIPAIRARLLERFEPSCVPRRIVALPELPRESNGKLPRARVLRMFKLDTHGQPLNFTLPWSAPSREAHEARESVTFTVGIPETYAWFDGHFPGYPVLAGAVQLKELVLPAVEKAFPGLGPVVEMSGIKFTGRILPGDDVVVHVHRELGRPSVQFEIRSRSTTCSAGRLAFASEAS